jgi:hypothetical protein
MRIGTGTNLHGSWPELARMSRWASVCRSLEWVSDYAGGRDDQTEGRLGDCPG